MLYNTWVLARNVITQFVTMFCFLFKNGSTSMAINTIKKSYDKQKISYELYEIFTHIRSFICNCSLFKRNGCTYRGGSFVKNVLVSLLKRDLPLGSKFFPFRVDYFSEGSAVQESKQEVTKVVSLV